MLTRRAGLPGFVVVALAAGLWGTDALFRRGLALELPATVVVFYEHLLLTLACLPLLARIPFGSVRWDRRTIISLLVIGAGASATATFLFTAAFRYGDPTTPLLLQKVQPLVAVAGAWVLLGERPKVRFGVFAALALGGAYLVSFPDPLEVSLSRLAPALLALGAATLWGTGTVLGRAMSTRFRPAELTALRFTVGLPASAVLLLVDRGVAGFGEVAVADFPALLGLAAVPGLLALFLYYRGLARTPASAATLAEMAFPLVAILIGRFVFSHTMTVTQWLGIAVLAGVLTLLSVLSRRGYEPVGIVAPQATPP